MPSTTYTKTFRYYYSDATHSTVVGKEEWHDSILIAEWGEKTEWYEDY